MNSSLNSEEYTRVIEECKGSTDSRSKYEDDIDVVSDLVTPQAKDFKI